MMLYRVISISKSTVNTYPDFARWISFAVTDLALKLSDVLAGQFKLGPEN